jgi:zinc transport system substrate-binding protein
MKKLFVFLLAGLFVPAGLLCAQPVAGSAKIKIVTTLFPLYEFAREVGGSNAEVSLLLPPGIEPHAYEPTPADISRINEADIFVYTGELMEPWVQRLLPGVTNQNLQIIDASQGNKLLVGRRSNEANERWEHRDRDPHIWLDFSIDMKIVDAVAEALIERDSAHSKDYLENADAYKAKLAALDAAYQAGLRECATRTVFFGGHLAFGYLATKYGLKFVSPYAGFSPDAEPSAQAVAGLITEMKKMGVKHIYFEELIDPKIARVIADEAGARAELLDAAHNISADEFAQGVTFLAIMDENLKKLREGLQCQ